jgi:FkbM family methyltransferase
LLNTARKVALARVASRGVRAAKWLLGQSPELVARRQGLNWRLDLREGIDFSIYLLGSFEPSTVRCYRRLVRPGDVVLDIGANIGAHTLPLARLVGDSGKVIAFEPTQFAFEKLLANIALNNGLSARISPLQMMLVAEPSSTVPEAIYSSWPLEDSDDVHEQHRGRLMDTSGARAAPLDDVLDELGIRHVNFIKLDVDGSEDAVLGGARETLRRHSPYILMELAPYVYDSKPAHFDALLETLWGAGYVLRDMHGGHSLPHDVQRIREAIPSAGSINVLASSS